MVDGKVLTGRAVLALTILSDLAGASTQGSRVENNGKPMGYSSHLVLPLSIFVFQYTIYSFWFPSRR